MASTYAKRLASIAEAQHGKYHLQDEADVPLSNQIKKYWTDLNLPFPGISTPWSAIFVSWCIKAAGATAGEFRFSQDTAFLLNGRLKIKLTQPVCFADEK